MNAVLFCVAALTLLHLGLSINVSRLRRKNRTDNPPSQWDIDKAVRAQGNASEYIPVFVALLLYMDAVPTAPKAFVITIAILALVSRTVHAIGLLSTPSIEQRHPFRPLGAFGTYLSLLLLGSALLVHAF
jgi:uncharacterized membrane protein YecN with MAPEG domain